MHDSESPESLPLHPSPAEQSLSPHEALQVVLETTDGIYGIWQELGPNRTDLDRETTDFAAECTIMDRSSEERMRDGLQELANRKGIKVGFISEELKRTFIDADGEVYEPADAETELDTMNVVAIGDGIDGSSNLFKAGARYGSILTIADRANPAYGNMLATAIGMFSDGKVLTAMPGGGTFVEDLTTDPREIEQAFTLPEGVALDDGIAIRAEIVDRAKLDEMGRKGDPLYNYFKLGTELGEQLRATGLEVERSGSTASDIFDIATGKLAASVQATRKGNLELTSAYLTITEAGGVMYALEQGEDGEWQQVVLNDKKFREYGQDGHVVIVMAGNQTIADGVVERLNRPAATG